MHSARPLFKKNLDTGASQDLPSTIMSTAPDVGSERVMSIITTATTAT